MAATLVKRPTLAHRGPAAPHHLMFVTFVVAQRWCWNDSGIQRRLLSIAPFHSLHVVYYSPRALSSCRFLSFTPLLYLSRKQVFRRFLRSDQRLAYSTTNATQSARKTDEFSTTLSHHPILAEQRGSDVGGWFDNVHSWVLALALRACRRRLLELAGWRDDHVGANMSPISSACVI